MYAFLIILFIVETHSISYDGYKVYEIYPNSVHEHYILEIWKMNYEVDFWIKSIKQDKKWVLMVSPDISAILESFMKQYNMTYYKIIDNLKKLIHYNKTSTINFDKMDFNHYYDYNMVEIYLQHISKYYDNTELFTIGNTVENRNIVGLKIFNTDKINDASILITGGMIGREWIGVITAIYIIDQIIKNSENKYLYENINWFIIPILNPDGYEYTHTTDRLWLKNRVNHKICYGVDISKNFDFHWGESSSGTDKICSYKYIGHKPFSERETKAFNEFMEENNKKIKLYLSLRAFGPMITYPWAYSKYSIRNWKFYEYLGYKVAKELYKNRNINYVVDSYISAKYAAGGTDIDWMYGQMNISLVYSIHMPSSKNNFFDPTESEIKEVVQEIFAGISVFHNFIETIA